MIRSLAEESSENLLPILNPDVLKNNLSRISSRKRSASDVSWFKWLFSVIKLVLWRSKISILLPSVPLAFVADFVNIGNAWVFVFSLIGLTPLAESLAFVTELLCTVGRQIVVINLGFVVGGLVNATCGNSPEMIIAIYALYHKKNDLVKYSVLGSILSNALLVLGMSLFCGGIVKKQQKFDKVAAGLNMSMLLMAGICVALPFSIMNLTSATTTDHDNDEQQQRIRTSMLLCFSRGESLLMLAAYSVYLCFQLKTHPEQQQQQNENNGAEGAEEEEEISIGLKTEMVSMILITLGITGLSQNVVETIEDTANLWGMPLSFITIVLLPLAGNAAEHAGAVMFAIKDKLDLSLSIALGSSTQISMFLMPLMPIMGWIMGNSVGLDFKGPETASLLGAIIITAYSLQDGTSNYMKGVMLMLCYLAISLCFFLVKYPFLQHEYR